MSQTEQFGETLLERDFVTSYLESFPVLEEWELQTSIQQIWCFALHLIAVILPIWSELSFFPLKDEKHCKERLSLMKRILHQLRIQHCSAHSSPQCFE